MSKNNSNIDKAKEQFIQLIELKLERMKLSRTEKLIKLVNAFFVFFIIILLSTFIAGLMAVAIGAFIGEMIGSLALGILISAIIMSLAVIILIKKKDTIFIDSLTKLFIKLLFTDNDKTDQKEEY